MQQINWPTKIGASNGALEASVHLSNFCCQHVGNMLATKLEGLLFVANMLPSVECEVFHSMKMLCPIQNVLALNRNFFPTKMELLFAHT